jgi:hypothetical protein
VKPLAYHAGQRAVRDEAQTRRFDRVPRITSRSTVPGQKPQ